MILIPVYAVYFALLYLFFSKNMLDLFNGTPMGTICGTVIFAALTAMTAICSIRAVSGRKKQPLLPGNTAAESCYAKYLSFAGEMRSALYRQENMGPFDSRLGNIGESMLSMEEKYSHVKKLIASAFSAGELTYAKYSDTVDSVLETFTANLSGIKKRMEVFDRRRWYKDHSDPVCVRYLTEIDSLMNGNSELLYALDKLIHELVTLGDTSDNTLLGELSKLTEQTEMYRDE